MATTKRSDGFPLVDSSLVGPGPGPEASLDTSALAASWRWLRDDERSNPAVLAHLDDENARTDEELSPLVGLRDVITERWLPAVALDTESLRVSDGLFEYWTTQRADQEHELHLRRRIGTERVELLLDENIEAAGGYFDLGDIAVSDDSTLIAWTADRDGSELYELTVRKVESSEVVLRLEGVGTDVEFDKDAERVFVLRLDDTQRPFQLWEVCVGTGAQTLLLQENDQRFSLGFERTTDFQFLLVMASSSTTSRAWALDLSDSEGSLFILASSSDGTRFELDHHGEWLALTNIVDEPCEASEFRLHRLDGPEPAQWPLLWAPPQGILLEGFQPRSGGSIVVQLRVEGTRRVGVLCPAEGLVVLEPQLDGGEAVSCSLVAELDPASLVLHVTESSFQFPSRTRRVRLDAPSESGVVVHVDAVEAGYDPKRYLTGCLDTVSHDGESVRLTYFARRDRKPVGAYLYGYGAYGECDDPEFVATWPALADAGMLLAVAHVRGGGERGERWHRDGKLDRKTNSFHDFAACAAELRHRFGVPVVARGGSAGGLLVGATLNLYPELFAGAVAEVPFVDCVATMSDPSLPLTVGEYEEWGDPRQIDQLRWIEAVSPVDNVTVAPYPPVFVTAGLHDPRVGYWEAAVWACVLRAASANPVLLRVRDSGHSGAAGRVSHLLEQAELAAFALNCVGVSIV